MPRRRGDNSRSASRRRSPSRSRRKASKRRRKASSRSASSDSRSRSRSAKQQRSRGGGRSRSRSQSRRQASRPSDRRSTVAVERDRMEGKDGEAAIDVYGRRRSAPDQEPASKDKAKGEPEEPTRKGSGARNGLNQTAALPSKAERQKAALERLRQKKTLSPPRTRVYREKSPRTLEAERRREARIFIG
eukprot:TRINITY_DN96043_c0_g1_i1.p1 TRINITY_DN96043_c0_g1~~TRINITY_DN96043_c0_g1_i1.p1  ORF type:complete len:189 (+),score=6.18 TRINITY_DN96043_c0_g1_i1:79-645(+)